MGDVRESMREMTLLASKMEKGCLQPRMQALKKKEKARKKMDSPIELPEDNEALTTLSFQPM